MARNWGEIAHVPRPNRVPIRTARGRHDSGRHVEFRLQRCDDPPPDHGGGPAECLRRRSPRVPAARRTRYVPVTGRGTPGVASEAAGRPVEFS